MGPLDTELRSTIRARARWLRRRRLAGAAAAALVVAGGFTFAGVSLASSPHQTIQVATTSDCPAASVPVNVRTGASVSLTRVPEGWTKQPSSYSRYSGGEPSVTYANTAQETQAAMEDRNVSWAAPSVTISLALQDANSPPTTSTPATGLSSPNGTVQGYPAEVDTQPGLPTAPQYTPTNPERETITWTPSVGTTVSVYGVNIRPAEMLAIADGARWDPGHIVPLPVTATYKVSAARAERALPRQDRRAARADLTAWAELYAVSHLDRAALDDYRAVWLVYSPTGAGRDAWAVVDADTGTVLEADSTSSAPWIPDITNRAEAGCNPPVGVLTRSEASYVTRNTNLVLTTGAQILHDLGVTEGTCNLACVPLVWAAFSGDAGGNMTVIDAVTGEIRVQGMLPNDPPTDLDPPSGAPAPLPSSTTRVTACPGLLACSGSPTSSSTTPTTVIVGPSPFYPGTGETKPAPKGNGHGLNGSCNGTETVPPCGPGVVANEYYPYTLPPTCNGYLYFDGRYWVQELWEPTTTTENVWISLGGWVGPGSVGLQPARTSNPPACNVTTPVSVPPLSG